MRGNHVPERLLRHIWASQFISSPLKTTDGRPIVVHFAGEINDDAGPDFRHAKITIGGITYVGDVEIHRRASEWISHAHDSDARYNTLILHVVLTGSDDRWPTVSASGRRIPTVVLEPFLSPALLEKITRAEHTYRSIPCRFLNGGVSPHLLEKWILELAEERLEMKVRAFQERLVELAGQSTLICEPRLQFGVIEREGDPADIPNPSHEPAAEDISNKNIWDQLLYEGIMDALGFSKNRAPFVRLSRNVTLEVVRSLALQRLADILALLYGASGLLALSHQGLEMEQRWHQLRPRYRGETLQQADWKLSPSRPANHPVRRMKAAAVIIGRILHDDLFNAVIRGMESESEPSRNLEILQQLLCVDEIEGERSSVRRQRLVGIPRANDIIANTILPLCFLYGRIYRKDNLILALRTLYEWQPPLSTNFALRLMERELIRGRLHLHSMRLQQGVLQLYGHYCREERCSGCSLGKVVFNDYIERHHARTTGHSTLSGSASKPDRGLDP